MTDAGSAGSTGSAGSARMGHRGSLKRAMEKETDEEVDVDGDDSCVIKQPRCEQQPWVCPSDGVPYDCAKRCPVRCTCACKRLMCRRCGQKEDVCTICSGTLESVTPCVKDDGMLLAVLQRMGPLPRYVACMRVSLRATRYQCLFC